MVVGLGTVVGFLNFLFDDINGSGLDLFVRAVLLQGYPEGEPARVVAREVADALEVHCDFLISNDHAARL